MMPNPQTIQENAASMMPATVSDRAALLELLYRGPSVSDRVVMQILAIGDRQLRKLITQGKLTRHGMARHHRIQAASVLARLRMPIFEPIDLSVW